MIIIICVYICTHTSSRLSISNQANQNMAEKYCSSTQLIDSHGVFNAKALNEFVDGTELSKCGLSYAVVAVIGPQSSGKSTLMNHLFQTDFRVMDAYDGRLQTTKGIWIARCPGINDPFTIALDLEETDGRERGEDDTIFEKQSTLFALVVADILLINIWCHDIGRVQAANNPLLKTVFQVMTRLFTPRKMTLLFVIRDKSKTPLEKLEQILMKDIEKIWNSIAKPNSHKETPFSDFFGVEVIALSSYEDKEEQFKEQVGQLRQRFFHSISPGGLAGDRRSVVPASGFSISSQQIWKIIKENKDLDLPSHKVMVSMVRCEEIANEKLCALSSDMHWLALSQDVQAGPVSGFGQKLGSILEKYFSEYDMEAFHFDEGVRNAKQHQLKAKALELVRPAYITMLRHLRHKTLKNFKTQLEQSMNNGEGFAASVHASIQSCMLEFDKGATDVVAKQADWNASKVREKLFRHIYELPEMANKYGKQLSDALTGPVGSLLKAGTNGTWPSIRSLVKRETENSVSEFSKQVASFEIDESIVETMVENLRTHAINIVEIQARVKAGEVWIHMKDRFSTIFCLDNNSKPRVWKRKEDIEAIEKDALSAALKLLSVMAAIRLDEKPDTIEDELISYLKYENNTGSSQSSCSWKEVSQKDTLLTPAQCMSLWKQFNAETKNLVAKAESDQVAYKRQKTSRNVKRMLIGGRILLFLAGLDMGTGVVDLASHLASEVALHSASSLASNSDSASSGGEGTC